MNVPKELSLKTLKSFLEGVDSISYDIIGKVRADGIETGEVWVRDTPFYKSVFEIENKYLVVTVLFNSSKSEEHIPLETGAKVRVRASISQDDGSWFPFSPRKVEGIEQKLYFTVEADKFELISEDDFKEYN